MPEHQFILYPPTANSIQGYSNCLGSRDLRRTRLIPRMSPDDPGMLGNLPRSRPGRRSDKRSGDSRTSPPPTAPSTGPERPDDPVGGALRAAAKGVGSGLRVANGVTRGVLRRFPRP